MPLVGIKSNGKAWVMNSLMMLLETLANIESNPLMYPVVHRNTRRAIIHRFPFGIYYRIVNDAAVVVAVIHCGRHPRHWKDRS